MDSTLDILIVGGGVAGIYSLYKMHDMGLSIKALEAGTDLGGTWYWNRYPGARCDADSLDYSFSFSEELDEEWVWSERYAGQPEILKYLNYVVDRFDLRDYFQFNARVSAAHYDEGERLWRVQAGEQVYLTRYLIMATGLLSAPIKPDIPGLGQFKGPTYFASS